MTDPGVGEQIPADLVVVGRVGEAYGLKGAVHIIPYSPDASALLAAREWWLEGPGKLVLRSVDVFSAKAHGGDGVVAQLVGVVDRDAAVKLRGAQVQVPRSRFPALVDDEYYWADLIGLEVVNEAGISLGHVTGLSENAAHAVLEVEGLGVDGKVLERLIPFVGVYVKTVDRAAGRVLVDWGLDY